MASAPSYAHGVVDPIEAIAAITREAGVLFHVDACIGGWLLPYYTRLGDDIALFDFRVNGVTSISMDLHKYAYTPKGASTLLYRSARHPSPSAVRQREVDRLHDDQHDLPVHQVGRPAGRGVGHPAGLR